MKTDKEKKELRDIQRDTSKAIYLMLENNINCLSGDMALGYLYCVEALKYSTVNDIDKFREYKTSEAIYEL